MTSLIATGRSPLCTRPLRPSRLVVALALLFIAAVPLRTQDRGGGHVAVSAGAAFPSNQFTDDADPGYQLGLHYQTPLGRRFCFRLGLDATKLAFPDAANGHWLLVGGMAHLVVPIRITSTVKPYLLGGVGATRLTRDSEGFPAVSDTKLAIGGGVGYDFRLMGGVWFTEARLITVETLEADGHRLFVIPITVGFRF